MTLAQAGHEVVFLCAEKSKTSASEKLQAQYLFLTVLLGERGLDKMKLSISHAVDRAIRYAEFLRLKSIAFPVLGSPRESPPYNFVAHQMLENVVTYFNRRNTKIKAILFSAYNADALSALQEEAKNISELS
jgi:O-acetyl-ADP-ribose deacetylase (regulator of RNase III)